MKEAVLQYDLAKSAGWALYVPGREAPRHGIVKLPSPSMEGSNGAMFKLLFDHVAWADRNFGLCAIGYEGFLLPTGGRKDDKTTFVTSPKTTKVLVGLTATLELCAEILEVPIHSVHNAAWHSFWLGPQKRGTKRDRFKQLALAKATVLGFDPLGEDDADALGQLHFLLHKLGIVVPWNTHAERDLITLMMAGMQAA